VCSWAPDRRSQAAPAPPGRETGCGSGGPVRRSCRATAVSCRSSSCAPDVARGKNDLPDGGAVQEVGAIVSNLTPDTGTSHRRHSTGWATDRPAATSAMNAWIRSRRRVNQPRDWAAHQLGSIKSEDAPDCLRGVGHDAVTIDDHDGIGAVRGQRAESLLRLPVSGRPAADCSRAVRVPCGSEPSRSTRTARTALGELARDVPMASAIRPSSCRPARHRAGQ